VTDITSFFQLGPHRLTKEIIGWRHHLPITIGDLFLRTADWQKQIRMFPGKNAALYLTDTLEFIAALLATLHEGKKVYLPPNALPATCTSLADKVDMYLGEFPSAYSPFFPKKSQNETQQESHVAFTVPTSAKLVIYTSGSTGEAKAIPKRISQLLKEAEALEKLFGTLSPQSDIVATVSHQHIYGLLFKVFWPLLTKRRIHAISLNFPEELLAVAAKHKISLISSPAHLKRFTENSEWRQYAHRIAMVFSSGGALERDVALKNREYITSAPVEIYGSSETGGIAWRQQKEEEDESWRPIPDVQWRIHPDEQTLEVLSPYLYEPNWFRMADRVTATNDNRFLLDGRIDRIVKIEEKRVSLTAIEQALMHSDLVENAKVILVDMEKERRQRLAAFVVLSPEGLCQLNSTGKLAMNQQLRNLLIPLFERVTFPKIWQYPKALPVNMQGKTTYAELKAILDHPTPPESLTKTPETTILEKRENHLLMRIVLPENLLYFQGHFPEVPILPGVVQLDWALTYWQQHFDLPCVFGGIQALKFQHVILPGTSVDLKLEYEPSKASLSFCYFSADKTHASGRIIFQPFQTL